MIRQPEIWCIIQSKMKRGKWVSLEEIYEIIQCYGKLDKEDFESQSPRSPIPKWKRNVRNVLQYRKKTGEISWGRRSYYKL